MSENYFAIIEIKDGMTIVECDATNDLEAVALSQQGLIIDPGPFRTFEEAYDELLNLEANEDDEVVE